MNGINTNALKNQTLSNWNEAKLHNVCLKIIHLAPNHLCLTQFWKSNQKKILGQKCFIMIFITII